MPKYAAVDIGSNSVRMEVAEVSPAGRGQPAMRILESDREVTRLGEAVFQTGSLADDATASTCKVLERMARAWQKLDIAGIRVVATSAVRDARNSELFLKRATAAIGAPVETISGPEEARLIHLGVHWRWPHPGQRVLIIDIGGGSAEVILGEGEHVLEAVSKPLGAVRLQELFLQSDPPTEAELQRLDDFIAEKLSPIIPKIAGTRIDRMIATAGSAAAVVSAAHRVDRKDRDDIDRHRATSAQIRRLYESVAHAPLEKRRRIPGINARRAEIIIPGVAVLRQAMAAFRQSSLYYSAAGVRDGIIADLFLRGVGRTQTLLDREQRSIVEQMARRYGVALPHARLVALLANEIYTALEPIHELQRSSGKLLHAAALLMDSGHYVSDSRHHRHSQYLVANSAMPGFTDAERNIIANLCRYHRKSLPTPIHQPYQTLTPADKRTVWLLTPILRLADALDRSRKQQVSGVSCELRPGAFDARVKARGRIDLELWAAEQAAPSFREVYGLKLTTARDS